MKDSARKSKQQYAERLAEETEMADELKDKKTIYQITMKPKGYRRQSQDFPLKVKDGELIRNESAKLDRFSGDLEVTRNTCTC